MLITVLKSKLHLVPVTQCDIHYEGSCAIDEEWLEEVNIRVGEQIHIYNQNNGERFITYAIKAPPGSRQVALNGAAARKAVVGDKLIIAAFAQINGDAELKPKVAYGSKLLD